MSTPLTAEERSEERKLHSITDQYLGRRRVGSLHLPERMA